MATPADPGLYTNQYWVTNSCNYIGTFKDLNGATYSPDTRNFMSYSKDECRNRFTPEQGQRMANSLRGLEVLKSVTKAPEIQGPDLVCTTATFSFTTLATSIITWSTSNFNGLSINPTTGVATRINNFNGQVTINASISNPCGSANITRVVHVGSPSSVTVGRTDCFDQRFSTDFVGSAAVYTWTIINLETHVSTFYPNHNYQLITGFGAGNYRVIVSNTCSSTLAASRNFTVTCSSPKIVVFPNPASSALTVQFTDSLSTNTQGTTLDQPYQLIIMDRFSGKVFSAQSLNTTIKIPTDGIPDGIYYLNVSYKDAVLRKQIFIKR